jgi:hypothetical protein
MAIDPDKLDRQRHSLEARRLKAELLEAGNRLREAELDAVRLGIRRECSTGCGRDVGKTSKTGLCRRCLKTRWMRESRQRLRLCASGEP